MIYLDTVKTHYVGTIVSNGSTFGSSQVRSVWNSHIISHELPSPLTDISHGLLVLALVAYTIRGTPFVTEIGVGKAIKGWDEGRAYYIPEASLSPLLIIADTIRCPTANGGI
jgi:FKBP-type peptidyl-prolyl cis-trans isomerase